MVRLHPRPTPSPYTTLFRSDDGDREVLARERQRIFYVGNEFTQQLQRLRAALTAQSIANPVDTVATLASVQQSLLARSEEHTSELQSLRHLVCRLLLGKTNA